MSLDEIKKELYKKDLNKKVLEHETSEFDTESIIFNLPEKEKVPADNWVEKKDLLGADDKKNIKKGAYALGGLLLVIALVVGFYTLRQVFFSPEKISISLEGPTEVESGNLITYEMRYKNNNRADLKNVVLRLTYPEAFRPEEAAGFKSDGTMAGSINLADIKGKTSGVVVFSGRTFSPRGNLIKIKAELSYMPSTISTKFVAESQLAVNVVSVPITLEVMAPQNISNNDEVNYLITYKNEGAEGFDNIRIRIEYPERFTFSKSDPRALEGNNIWYIGSLAGGQSGKIVVAGKLEGNRDEVKTAKITIGSNSDNKFVSYNEKDVQTRIISSPLTIAQTVNGLNSLNANAGEQLRFEINYRNEGTTGLRDVIVTENIDSAVLDYNTLDLFGGAYDSNTKTITWKASDYKELKNLAPGQGGTIKFSIKVKEIIPVNNANDKNFVISSLTKIDSPDIPTPISMNKIISGNKMDIKLNSKLVLDVKGYYNDTNIPNSGPIPPKVGEETTYTIYFRLLNISNDVSDAKVEAVLPTSDKMTGVIFPEGSPLIYNERTNSVVWVVGNLAAGTGLISDAEMVAFQVKLKPSPNQAGDEALLLNESVFSARDLFTGESISARVESKSTRLIEDSTLKGGYKVVN